MKEHREWHDFRTVHNILQIKLSSIFCKLQARSYISTKGAYSTVLFKVVRKKTLWGTLSRNKLIIFWLVSKIFPLLSTLNHHKPWVQWQNSCVQTALTYYMQKRPQVIMLATINGTNPNSSMNGHAALWALPGTYFNIVNSWDNWTAFSLAMWAKWKAVSL